MGWGKIPSLGHSSNVQYKSCYLGWSIRTSYLLTAARIISFLSTIDTKHLPLGKVSLDSSGISRTAKISSILSLTSTKSKKSSALPLPPFSSLVLSVLLRKPSSLCLWTQQQRTARTGAPRKSYFSHSYWVVEWGIALEGWSQQKRIEKQDQQRLL